MDLLLVRKMLRPHTPLLIHAKSFVDYSEAIAEKVKGFIDGIMLAKKSEL